MNLEKKTLLKRVLIIDDDAFLIKLIDMVLSTSGYQVISARQGKEAIKILSEQAIDMIVVDLMMPEMDGLEFLRWLRQEAKLQIPTLVQTGMAKESIKKLAMEAGATDLILKPVKIEEFLDAIKKLEHSL